MGYLFPELKPKGQPGPTVNITQPTLKLLCSSYNPNSFQSTTQIYCFMYGHILEDVTVTWLNFHIISQSRKGARVGLFLPSSSPALLC